MDRMKTILADPLVLVIPVLVLSGVDSYWGLVFGTIALTRTVLQRLGGRRCP